MLTAACKDELPNPHRNCLNEVLSTLLVRYNDYRRMSSELRNLKAEFKAEMRIMEFPCSELRRLTCCTQYEKSAGDNFLRRVGRVNEVYVCFTQRIEKLEAKMKETLENAKVCVVALNAEKLNLKRFHERTVDHLKRTAIMSTDPLVIANCERDLCEMHRLFVKEVASIKRVENELRPFFEKLESIGNDEGAVGQLQYTDCDCLQHYDWIPAEKGLGAVDGIGEAIKAQMGSTLVKAFAQAHIHQPSDVKGFLAAYLLNLERNDKVLQEKIKLLGNVETVTCEIVL